MRYFFVLVAALGLAAGTNATTAQDRTICGAKDQGTTCSAAVAIDLDEGLLKGIYAGFYAPTHRYGHNVLGDTPKWGELSVLFASAADHGGYTAKTVVLPELRVFEDIYPRLADLDGDHVPEVIVVESDRTKGASLAIYGLVDLELVKLAATPFIGAGFRWLAPFAIHDLDGDGTKEIAYIDRPHLARTLRIWHFQGDKLTQIATKKGLTNHRIGQAFIQGGVRDCGDGPELITADANWASVMGSRLVKGKITSRSLGSYAGPASIEQALGC